MATRKSTKPAKKATRAAPAKRSAAQQAREHIAVISKELAALKALLSPRPGKLGLMSGSQKKDNAG